MENLLKEIILDISMRLPCGGALINFEDDDHLTLLENALSERGISNEDASLIFQSLGEIGKDSNNLSSDDIRILKSLGLKLKSESDFRKIKIEDVNTDSVRFVTGGGHRVFDEKTIGFRQLYSFIRSQSRIHITVSTSVNKMRSAENIRICQWGPSRGPGSANFQQIISIFKLYKQFPKIIEISTRAPTGINYELQRVEELNDILNKSATASNIYIMKDKKVVPMHVAAKYASKITGVGKADIALENEQKREVFWISYKHGDYFGKEGQVLLSVPFQQYGSIQGLYDSGFLNKPLASDQDVSGKDMQKFINSFITEVLRKSGLSRYSINNAVKIDAIGKSVLIYRADGKVVKIEPNHAQHHLAADPIILKKMAKNVRKEGKLNLHFFVQGTPEYYFDMMKESELLGREQLNTIAGKAIYGTNFFIGNSEFGRENINLLIQTSKKLMGFQHKIGDEVDGIVLQTDERGHVLINPNLPTSVTEELGRVLDVYVPVLFARFTRNESFKWTDNSGKNMIIGGRFLILPKGKMPSKAVEVEI